MTKKLGYHKIVYYLSPFLVFKINKIDYTLNKDNCSNNNSGVFTLRRLHPDDNERVVTTLWTEAHYI